MESLSLAWLWRSGVGNSGGGGQSDPLEDQHYVLRGLGASTNAARGRESTGRVPTTTTRTSKPISPVPNAHFASAGTPISRLSGAAMGATWWSRAVRNCRGRSPFAY